MLKWQRNMGLQSNFFAINLYQCGKLQEFYKFHDFEFDDQKKKKKKHSQITMDVEWEWWREFIRVKDSFFVAKQKYVFVFIFISRIILSLETSGYVDRN